MDMYKFLCGKGSASELLMWVCRQAWALRCTVDSPGAEGAWRTMKAVSLERGGRQFVVNTLACHLRVCRDGPHTHFEFPSWGCHEYTLSLNLCIAGEMLEHEHRPWAHEPWAWADELLYLVCIAHPSMVMMTSVNWMKMFDLSYVITNHLIYMQIFHSIDKAYWFTLKLIKVDKHQM